VSLGVRRCATSVRHTGLHRCGRESPGSAIVEVPEVGGNAVSRTCLTDQYSSVQRRLNPSHSSRSSFSTAAFISHWFRDSLTILSSIDLSIRSTSFFGNRVLKVLISSPSSASTGADPPSSMKVSASLSFDLRSHGIVLGPFWCLEGACVIPE